MEVLAKGNTMRETEKLAKTVNDGMDIGISIFKWMVIIGAVIIFGGAAIATLVSL